MPLERSHNFVVISTLILIITTFFLTYNYKYTKIKAEINKNLLHILNDSPNPIIMCKGDKLIFLNKAALSVTGYTEIEVLGKSTTILIPTEYVLKHKKGINKRVESAEEKTNYYILPIKQKDGSIVKRKTTITSVIIDEEPYFIARIDELAESKMILWVDVTQK